MNNPGYMELVEAARHPADPVTLAFAGVIALAPTRAAPYDVSIAGLDAAAVYALRARHFPRLPASFELAGGYGSGGAREDEFSDLVGLLLEHRTLVDEESTWLAYATATASMSENHLWQDMGLPDRAMLSWLMSRHFASLAVRNTGDMKWKKFFYKQLCERAEINVCKAPSCGVCADYSVCFGPEHAEPRVLVETRRAPHE